MQERHVAKRKVYHVVNEDGRWKAKVERGERASVTGGQQAGSTRAGGKELAQRGELGQVIIHRQDGSIEKEFTYGQDPRRTKG